jgi:hypothetical protein
MEISQNVLTDLSSITVLPQIRRVHEKGDGNAVPMLNKLGTTQAGRWRIRFSIRFLDFSIDLILPASLWPWGQLSVNRNEYQESSWV